MGINELGLVIHDTNGDPKEYDKDAIPPYIFTNDNEPFLIKNASDDSWAPPTPLVLTSVEELAGIKINSDQFQLALLDFLQANMSSTETIDNSALLSAVSAAVQDHVTVTAQAMDYKEIEATTSYINGLQTNERNRLNGMHNSFKRSILNSKTMYLMVKRDAQKKRAQMHLVLVSVLFACLVGILTPAALRSSLVTTLIFALALAFLAYVVFTMRVNSQRRQYDWGKYYHDKGNLESVEVEGDGEEDEADEQAVAGCVVQV